VEVAGVQVSHDGIDGLAADGDRSSPGRAEGKQQGQAESDHGREAADEKGRPPAAAQCQGGGVHDQRRPGEEQDGHEKGGELTGGRGQAGAAVAGEGIQGSQQFGARGRPEGGAGGLGPDGVFQAGDGVRGGGIVAGGRGAAVPFMGPHRLQVTEQSGLDRLRVDAGAGRRPGQAGCVGGLAAHDSLRRCQETDLAGQRQAHQQREDRSERGHERRRDGVGSLPVRGRDQGPHR
jgi:hypothetical protein